MSTEQSPAKQEIKKLTVTLTDRPPVKIAEDDWPIIASSKWSDHDNQYEFQANRTWSAWIKVRQHDDGRTLVYGKYDYSTQFQGESDEEYREGDMLTPSADDYPETARDNYWAGQPIIDAIRAVGERLAERSGKADVWRDLIAECIADLPAEDLS